MARRPGRITYGYVAVLLGAFVVASAAAWTGLAGRMDRAAYDWLFRIHPVPARAPQSAVLAIDEDTLNRHGGMRKVRTIIARGLDRVIAAGPTVVPIDVVLSESGDASEDALLASVLRRTPNVILASDVIPGTDRWEEPAPAFRPLGKAIGHVHAAPDPVSRVLPLEVAAGRDRRWAMALEAARLHLGCGHITESPRDLEVAGIHIPAPREAGREMYIRYREGIPVVSLAQVLEDSAAAERFRGKAVFVGITAQTAARDRLVTPFEGRMMSGVEIHAQAFETIAGREFLAPAARDTVLAMGAVLTVAAGLVFAFLSGWTAYAAGAAILLIAHVSPHIAFQNGVVLPYLAPVWAAWLSVAAAASWQHFIVRRQLRKSESDKARYQQAIHFVTHEMRSPLTAIQGSSELMGRYNLTDEKRKQMAQMINSESKRLAKMIQTFLDIERLTDGQMEIKSEPFDLVEVVDSCIERARALAERKQITLVREEIEAATLQGDRELLEYAVYNLLTNAVKYSPASTVVTVSNRAAGSQARLSVQDQGIGMDEKELKNIGTKFYRTKRAEASGEVGTGIGLSLVHQIVSHHNGRVEVTSAPGKGSCFTMVLPAIPACSRSM
jgi:two-component system sensor histidine kinase SenX3